MLQPLKCFLGSFAFVWLAAVQLATADGLDEKIQKHIQAAKYQGAHWGLLAVELKTGDTVYALDADKLFTPASTTKLFSTATALDALGADYRFQTPVYAHGTVDDRGVLGGDLVLVASGDLSLGGRTDSQGHVTFANDDHTYADFRDVAELTGTDPLGGLKQLAELVKASGIRRVDGEVIVDDRLFDHDVGTGSGPTQVTPIIVNDNLIDVAITPGEEGSAAKIEWRPHSATIVVDAAVETVHSGGATRVRIFTSGEGRITVRGQIAAGRKTLVKIVEVPEPASFARALFIEALRGAGIVVDASPLASNPAHRLPDSDDYGKLRQVAGYQSPPFAESARLILKVSHNLHASTLPLLVAARNGQRTLADGLRLQHDFLKRSGVPVETISFGGGAGGSPSDLVTPRAVVALLQAMSKRTDFATYRDALPVLGADGTLALAVDKDSPAKGKAQAKTGTYVIPNRMNGGFILTSKALAGYLTRADGRELAFAFYVNNVRMQSVNDSQNIGRDLGKLCEFLYASE